MFLGISLCIGSLFNQTNVYAESTTDIEQLYLQVGYKKVEEAVEEFEKLYETKIELPTKFPFEVKFSFGRVTNHNGFPLLELEHSNKLTGESLIINIFPKDKAPKLKINQTFTLKDGTKAKFFESNNIQFLQFQNNKVDYLMSISKRKNADQFKDLIEIAESLK